MKSKKRRTTAESDKAAEMADSTKTNTVGSCPNSTNNGNKTHTRDTSSKDIDHNDYLNILSLEILCNILNCLHLRDFLKLDHLSRKLHDAVSMHLRTLKTLDFSNRDVISWICGLSDQSFIHLCKRCNDAQYIYGFHPTITSKRRHRGKKGLSIPGIIDALTILTKLKGIEVSDTLILETIFSYFPNIEVMGTFRNRNGCFPVIEVNSLLIPENPLITSMHLFGIVVPRLPPMVLLKDLQLHHVHFTNTHPFTDFAVPSLKCFVMANCAGPADFLRYVPLIAGLAAARSLKRLELIRVPFLGGLLHHVIGESLRVQRFKNLKTLKFGACKHVIVMDAGFLAIASAENLEEMYIQPSLSKDSLFVALKMSFARFPVFNRLCLGYTEPFQESGNWTNQDLAIMGLAYIVETPAPITDNGMKSVGECFMTLKFLEIYNCPHLCSPTRWLTPAANAWDSLRELVLRKCHALKLDDFCDLIPSLPSLEAVHLDQMFREPPKGCSRVGISTGSGFGLSSSLIPGDTLGGGIGQNNQPANQSHDSDSSSSDSDGEEQQHPPQQPIDPTISNQGRQLPQSDPLTNQLKSRNSDQPCQNSSANPDNVQSNDSVSQVTSQRCDTTGQDTSQRTGSVSKITSQRCDTIGQGTSQRTDSASQVTSWRCDTIDQGTSQSIDSVSQVTSQRCDTIDQGTVQRNDSVQQVTTQSTDSVCHSHSIDTDQVNQTTEEKIHVSDTMVTENISACGNQAGQAGSPVQLPDLINCEPCFNDSAKSVDVRIEDNSIKNCDDSEQWIDPISENDYSLSNTPHSILESRNEVECSGSALENSSNERSSSNSVVNSERGKNLLIFPSISSDKDYSNTPSSGECSCIKQRRFTDDSSGCSSGSSYSYTNQHNCTCNRTHSVDPSSTCGRQNSACCEILLTTSDKSKCKNCDSLHLNEPEDINDQISDFGNNSSKSSLNMSNSKKTKESSMLQENCRLKSSLKNKNSEALPENFVAESKTIRFDEENQCDHLNAQVNLEPVIGEGARDCGSVTTASDSVVAETSAAPDSRREWVGKSLYGKKKGLVRKNSNSKGGNEMDGHTYDEKKDLSFNYSNVDKVDRKKEAEMINGKSVSESPGTYDQDDSSDKIVDFSVDHCAKESSTKENVITITKMDEETGKEIILFSGKIPLSNMPSNQESDVESDCCRITRSRAQKMAAGNKRRQNRSPVVKKRKLRKTKKTLDLVVMADKWCQVDASGLRHHKGDQEKCKCGTSGYLKVMTQNKKRPVMLSKGTSTSDPVMEEDYTQVLKLKSRSLQCITLNMVGVTDIQIGQCPQLSKLTAHSCRVLKNFQVDNDAASLTKVQLTQCQKLNTSTLIEGIKKLESKKSRVIILRPMLKLDTTEIERSLFSSTDVDYGICIVYDYSTDPSYTMYNRVRVQSWVELLSGMNSELLNCYGFKKHTAAHRTDKYPWGRSIYTLKGYNNNSSRWELITDIPWLRPLYESSDLDSEEKIKSFDDKKEGLYCPGAKGHESFSDCIWECLPNIVDETSVETPLFQHSLFIYVNFCDINGSANFDPYA